MVLGVDWLRDISPVTFDFRGLTLQFSYEGKRVTLHGMTNGISLRVIGVDFLDDITNGRGSWATQLNSLTGEPMEVIVPMLIQKLIAQHRDLFRELTERPPSALMTIALSKNKMCNRSTSGHTVVLTITKHNWKSM